MVVTEMMVTIHFQDQREMGPTLRSRAVEEGIAPTKEQRIAVQHRGGLKGFVAT